MVVVPGEKSDEEKAEEEKAKEELKETCDFIKVRDTAGDAG